MDTVSVIFDHDGGVDDLLSLKLLLTMDHVDIVGITITPADCFLSDATVSTLKILKMFDRSDIPVALGRLQGTNPFPYEWRAQPKICNALPAMLNIEQDDSLISLLSADEFIQQSLASADKPITVLLTGPCTNLVAACEAQPSIKDNIREVVWMGGAVEVVGNVAMHNHNATAEWNVYWDPESTAKLFASQLTIKLIALDATNLLPVDMAFLKQLAGQRQYPLSDLAGQFWATTINSIPSYEYTYHLWDMLATAYLALGESAITFERQELVVSVSEPNAGQTNIQAGSGQWIDVAKHTDREKVLGYILEQFKR